MFKGPEAEVYLSCIEGTRRSVWQRKAGREESLEM